VIERAGQLVGNGTISPEALAEAIDLGTPGGRRGLGGAALRRSAGAQRAELISVCEAENGNAARIAHALGIHRATLFRRLKRAGISLRILQESS